MHKPLASCMWVFLKRRVFLLKSDNALLMHRGVNRRVSSNGRWSNKSETEKKAKEVTAFDFCDEEEDHSMAKQHATWHSKNSMTGSSYWNCIS